METGTTGRRAGRRFALRWLAAVLIALVALPAAPTGTVGAAPYTYTVTNGADSGLGTLRAAVAASNANDPGAGAHNTISLAWLAGSTITLTGGQLTLTRDVDVQGPTAGVTISGNNNSRVFSVDTGATVTMSRLTITGGKVAGDGGGILNKGSLTLTQSTVSGNGTSPTTPYSTGQGGGIANTGTLTLTDVAVSGNRTGDGVPRRT